MTDTSHTDIRALNIYKTYFPDPQGGMQEAIRQLCLATSIRGVSNTIFTLSPNPHPVEIYRPEGKIVRSLSWASPASCDIGTLESLRRFSDLAAQSDVLHYMFPWPYADMMHMLTAPKTPAVLTYVSDVVRQRWLAKTYEPLMWKTLRSMKVIVANSPAYARTSPILANRAIRDKVRVIPLGIVETSYPLDGDDSVFERLGLESEEQYFLFIGVLRYYKGLHTLIQAAQHVKTRIVIAGSGPELWRLNELSEQLGTRNIVFAGQVSDAEKVTLLKHCRALVLPSHLRSEAYGMVLVEAAMMGKPMISCEIGTGTSYVNLHEETGFEVPPESPQDIARAINTLSANDDLIVRFGRASRLRYETYFSGDALGKAYTDLYQDVLNESV